MTSARRPAAALGATLGVLVALAAAVVVPDLDPSEVAAPLAPASAPEPDVTPAVVAPSLDVAEDRAWGPSGQQWSEALAAAQGLSLEAAAGQVIVPRWSSPNAGALAATMHQGGWGGVILMGGAVTTADALATLTDAAQAADGGRAWGTLISTDQEGGTVARLSGLVPDLPGFMAAGAARDKEAVERVYAQAGVDMRELGITMDFAPVADMTIGMADPIIRTRSAGSKVDNVSATVVSAVDGYLDGGVVPVIKHFPGHGSVTVDSHAALPVQAASLEDLERRDIVPFERAIEAGAPAIMMGHIALAAWGGQPATVAPAAYAYVRQDLGFDGLIITDALDMGAITDSYVPGDAAVAALAAGADVLLMPIDPLAARDAIVRAVDSGELPRERLDEAAARMIALQAWQQRLGPRVDTGANYGRDLAVEGATVAAQRCGGSLVGDAVVVSGAAVADRARVAGALEARGVDVVRSDSAAAEAATTVLLLGSDGASGTADVVVALAGPWGLSSSTARAFVGLYGRSADAIAGLADVLTGAADPGGQWPVPVDVPYDTCS
ncbi:glycoside hydrolase family 3 N-terminal domain-containing protein [Demequina activiva]|uniref:beta-N-acetylhexosaminidase n=1 Tax=Demequina activiva TaxID=1582364 RepID=A0A919Q2E4_9MICO|nr:glycoside hydrolase family 3 N-terminal domain-containing protein [Demequina activiva]GIG54784.1 hypothetical protein Dac01nite_15360 [Demequina activiva]